MCLQTILNCTLPQLDAPCLMCFCIMLLLLFTTQNIYCNFTECDHRSAHGESDKKKTDTLIAIGWVVFEALFTRKPIEMSEMRPKENEEGRKLGVKQACSHKKDGLNGGEDPRQKKIKRITYPTQGKCLAFSKHDFSMGLRPLKRSRLERTTHELTAEQSPDEPAIESSIFMRKWRRALCGVRVIFFPL